MLKLDVGDRNRGLEVGYQMAHRPSANYGGRLTTQNSG